MQYYNFINNYNIRKVRWFVLTKDILYYFDKETVCTLLNHFIVSNQLIYNYLEHWASWYHSIERLSTMQGNGRRCIQSHWVNISYILYPVIYITFRKQNSFYLQTPYRMYKCYCNDWKTSELWYYTCTKSQA